MDLGTGDGAAVLRLARREPQTLVIGVDTDAAAMREASDRASRKPMRGGLTNALFLAGTLDEVPAALNGTLSGIRATLPWGSLLSSALQPEPAFAARVLALLGPGGIFELTLSLVERDQSAATGPLDEVRMNQLAGAYRTLGFVGRSVRPVTRADVEATGSTWAKRLGIPHRRPAWVLQVRRAVPAAVGEGTSACLPGVYGATPAGAPTNGS